MTVAHPLRPNQRLMNATFEQHSGTDANRAVVAMDTAREANHVIRTSPRTNFITTPRPITATAALEQNGLKVGAVTVLPKMTINDDKRPITALPKIKGNGFNTPRVPMINNFMSNNNSNGSLTPRGKRRRSRANSVHSDADSRLSVSSTRRSSNLSEKKTRKVSSEISSNEANERFEYDPHEAWNTFVKYVQSIHVTPTYVKKHTDKSPEERDKDYGLVKECKTSSVFRKTFDDIKKKNQKANRMSYLRTLVSSKNITQKLPDLKTASVTETSTGIEENDSDSDADSAFERDEEHRRNMSYGKVGWSIIRSYVRGKILERKQSKKGAGFNWNVLRQQLLAMSNMDRHRQDLYTRYGIIPPVGSRVARSTMLVEMSDKAREIMEKYKNPAQAPSSAKHRNRSDST